MKIYKDIFTGDELSSDSFPMKLVDDFYYEFKGRFCVRSDGDVVLAGSNPSAEEADEGNDEHVERGLDFVLNHSLEEMNMYEDPAMLKKYMKDFSKAMIERLTKDGASADEIAAFKTKIQGFFVRLLKKDVLKTLQFFVGPKGAETGGTEGQLCIVEFREGADGNEEPTLMLLKAALEEEKC